MFLRRIPEWLRHAPAPGVKSLAVLAGLEATARGMLTSAFPILMYRRLGDAETVSEVYFLIGLLSLAAALLTPWASRLVPRRWLVTLAAGLLFSGALAAGFLPLWVVPFAVTVFTVATVIITICMNAYVMDYIERTKLGECETLRLFYSAAAWSIGPILGFELMDKVWFPLPFILSGLASCALLAVFWVRRLGNGKVITKARRPAANPLAYLPRFFAQPRLIAGWIFAVVKSCGWWVYAVYLPIYAVEQGLPDNSGAIMLSVTNACLFLAPFMLKLMVARSVRLSVIWGYVLSGLAFTGAWALAGLPYPALGLLFVGSFFLILLDICAGLPFLMAVKPSERTEMSAVYSTFRDVSGLVTPGVARLVLIFAPLPAVFAACGLGLLATAAVALRLHPRLGAKRIKLEGVAGGIQTA